MGKQAEYNRFRNSPRDNPGTGGSTLQRTFGLPPDNIEPRTNEMIKKSMPVARFFPSVPVFQRGLDLFHISTAWKQYTQLLRDNQFSTPNTENDGIEIAFLADNFPTDSFTNEYGENFLQKFTNVASEGASSIAQIMGANKASDAWKTLQGSLSKSDNKMVSMFGGLMSGVGNIAGAGNKALSTIPVFKQGLGLVDKLLAGSRIDFPMVWKSSGFQPSYSLTCRLYNPFPQSEEATKKFIIGPIVAIMLMAVPRAQDSATYTWPFLHRIECPGIFNLNPGFISNVTVVKGGDQQQISFQQRLGIVDVRIDIGSLYSSMMGGVSSVSSQRPTVYDYATNLMGEDKVSTRVNDNKYVGGSGAGSSIGGDRDVGETEFGTGAFGGNVTPGTGRGIGHTNTGGGISPKRAATATNEGNTPADRVSNAAKEVYERLKGLGDVLPG